MTQYGSRAPFNWIGIFTSDRAGEKDRNKPVVGGCFENADQGVGDKINIGEISERTTLARIQLSAKHENHGGQNPGVDQSRCRRRQKKSVVNSDHGRAEG